MTGDIEILAPRMPGESNNQFKCRRQMAVLDYVRQFYLKHGHARIPEGVAAIDGTDAAHFWNVTRANFKNGTLPQYAEDGMRELADLGVSLVPESRQQRKKLRENLAPPEQHRLMPYLQAITAFAERHGHTNIPDHVVSRVGELRYGVTANAWRRARAGGVLSAWLAKKLEEIPGWTWNVVEGPRPREVLVLPDDTTQMRRSGLKQYLPGD